MARYIDSDRLLKVLETNFGHTGRANVLAQLINAQPTADVVEVVRCKDCGYRNAGSIDRRCKIGNKSHYHFDFCSYSKRREVE